MARVENDESSDGEENEVEIVIEGDDAMDNDQENDDSEEESSDDEDEGELEKKVKEIENKILANPYVYEDHVELISILQKLTDLSRIRAAFERLAGLCTLAPEQWLQRLQTEMSVAHSAKEREDVNALFKLATSECYSIQIYMEWCAFSMGGDTSVEDTRAVIDRVLTAAGDDPLNGTLVWDTAKEFELAHMSLASSGGQDASYKTQVQRVFAAYAGQLTRPLIQTDRTLKEFEDFVTENKDMIDQEEVERVKAQHKIATDILNELIQFEDKLGLMDNKTPVEEKCTLYKEYIDTGKAIVEKRIRDLGHIENLIPVLYDRATYECASSTPSDYISPTADRCESLLIEYADLARRRFSPAAYWIVLERCGRRWPRRAVFWVKRIQEKERRKVDFDEIKTLLETGLCTGLTSASDYVELWMAYLEALKRYTDFHNMDDVEKLRRTFRLAWDSLGEMWGDTADPSCSILHYWSRIEYHHTRDYTYGRELFDEILHYGSHLTQCNMWLSLLALERSRVPQPAVSKLRELHRRAVRHVSDWPRSTCDAWRDFERDYGTVDSGIECEMTCKQKLAEWQKEYEVKKDAKLKKSFNQKNKLKSKGVKNTQSADNRQFGNREKFGGENAQVTDDNRNSGRQKRRNAPAEDGENDIREEQKKRKMEESKVENGKSNSKTDDIGSKEKNKNLKRLLAGEVKEDSSIKKRRMSKDDRKSTPPPGYKGDLSEDARSPAGSERSIEDEEAKASHTVFVSNLDFKIDEDSLRSKLAEFGEIASFRVVRGVKAFGGSICYCEYKDTSSVTDALAHDRTPLDGRPIFISRYRPARTNRAPAFRYSTGPEPNKLFVKNLSFESCNEESLKEFFAPYGELKGVRIVQHKDGKPRGLAYVEYTTREAASRALLATDGSILAGRALQVAVSAPPQRAAPQRVTTVEAASQLGGGRVSSTGSRGRSRTQLAAFLPRAVQKAKIEAVQNKQNGSDMPDDQKPTTSRMSNSDFRNLLLGKKEASTE